MIRHQIVSCKPPNRFYHHSLVTLPVIIAPRETHILYSSQFPSQQDSRAFIVGKSQSRVHARESPRRRLNNSAPEDM